MNIQDKEELIAELEEHLAQVYEAIYLIRDIPRAYIRERALDTMDVFGSMPMLAIEKRTMDMMNDIKDF